MSKDNKATPNWREVLSETAYQGTLREAMKRWDLDEPAFNYRWEHVQEVVKLAGTLADLTGADREVVEAAAWLHDYHKRGKNDDHAEKGARSAREILAQTDFPPEKIDRVAEAISKHVGLFKDYQVEPLDAAVLWDADKLSKLGITSILHFAGFFSATGKGNLEQMLEELQSALEWQEKTVNSFNTEPARTAGLKRFQAQKTFLDRLKQELDGSDLGNTP